MPAAKRPCRVKGCTNPLRAGLLVCPPCWRGAPRELKRAMRAATPGTESFFSICRTIIGVLGDELDVQTSPLSATSDGK